MRRLLERGYGVYAALILGVCTLAVLPFVVLMPTLALRRSCGRLGVRLALALSFVPVVPAVIRGSRRLFGGDKPRPRWGALDVELFAPLAPSGDHRHAIEALRDEARRVVLAHCGEPDRRDAPVSEGNEA